MMGELIQHGYKLGHNTKDNIFEKLLSMRRWAINYDPSIKGWSTRILYRENHPTLLLQRISFRLIIYMDGCLRVCILPQMDDLTDIDLINGKWKIGKKSLTKKSFLTIINDAFAKYYY